MFTAIKIHTFKYVVIKVHNKHSTADLFQHISLLVRLFINFKEFTNPVTDIAHSNVKAGKIFSKPMSKAAFGLTGLLGQKPIFTRDSTNDRYHSEESGLCDSDLSTTINKVYYVVLQKINTTTITLLSYHHYKNHSHRFSIKQV